MRINCEDQVFCDCVSYTTLCFDYMIIVCDDLLIMLCTAVITAIPTTVYYRLVNFESVN
jgi:hypothetical protein